MRPDSVLHAEARYLVQTYLRAPVKFTHGEGVRLYDSKGKSYLDFAAGIAVNALGHSHPAWIEALTEQGGRLAHVSNLFHTAPQVELAQRLVEHSFADRVFFSNSGSEANETALKFARKWARALPGASKDRFVAFQGGFHGRSMGALSLTHKPAYREPFGPLVPGVEFAPFNDLSAASELVTDRTCAVVIEPIQGEGGVRPAEPDFLTGLRRLCDEHQALLVFDEIQCGLGRTGRLWAHQASGIEPDIMTLAKPLAGGLPIGATLVREKVADAIQAGDHGSTFGGGPLVCHVAAAVFDQISRADFLADVAAKGDALQRGLRELSSSDIQEVRGAGLLIGMEFPKPVKALIEAALQRGLVLISAGENVLRICPPLIIETDEIEAGLAILAECLAALADGS